MWIQVFRVPPGTVPGTTRARRKCRITPPRGCTYNFDCRHWDLVGQYICPAFGSAVSKRLQSSQAFLTSRSVSQLISRPDHIAALRAAYESVTQSKADFLSSLECFKACTPDNITQASALGRS